MTYLFEFYERGIREGQSELRFQVLAENVDGATNEVIRRMGMNAGCDSERTLRAMRVVMRMPEQWMVAGIQDGPMSFQRAEEKYPSQQEGLLVPPRKKK